MPTNRARRFARRFPTTWDVVCHSAVARRLIYSIKESRKSKAMGNLRRILVGDPVLQVDEFDGIFALGVSSDIFHEIVMNGAYEPENVRLCERYLDPNRDVIDVGANAGLYSVLFAKRLAEHRVLSIEPTKHASRRLRQNIRMNNVEGRVEVFQGVASNKVGVSEIKTIDGKEEYSSLGSMEHPCIATEKWILEEVESSTIDELVKRHSLAPGFLKVDVEGAEHLVFDGAHRVLTENRPIIVSELCDFLLRRNGSSAGAVIDLIRAHEYAVLDPRDHSVVRKGRDFGDILCIPVEMSALWDG